MQYCESCTSPRTPEYLLYLYHTHLRSLPWRHLHPDTLLMKQLFNVRAPGRRPPNPPTTTNTTTTTYTTDTCLDMDDTGWHVNFSHGSWPPSSYY